VSPESGFRVIPKELFKSDFVLDFYDPNDLSGVETHVQAFFGEKLMRPRCEKLWVGRDGTLDPNYVTMMERSIAYWRNKGDEKAVSRFEKELEGAKNAATLILESGGNGDPLPVVINASDPGRFYVDKEGKKKSVTFVWMFDSIGVDGWNYNVYSLPTKHIGLYEHWEILKKLGDLQRTENILKHTLTELSAEELIAFPVILRDFIEQQNELAHDLGYLSWQEIEEMAADQLALEHDPLMKKRREKIIIEFTALIFYAVKDRKDKEYKEALVNAMSDTMALEAGSRDYLGMNAKQIEAEIDKNVKLALAIKYEVFEKKSYHELKDLGIRFGDLGYLYRHYQWVSNAFNTNQLAREARATGCGGSGSNYGSDMFSNRDFIFRDVSSLIESQSFYSNISEVVVASSGGEEPEGRYSEGVYKPGHCRACDTDRKKVWHKEDGGCDCCTTCEHRLAGGD